MSRNFNNNKANTKKLHIAALSLKLAASRGVFFDVTGFVCTHFDDNARLSVVDVQRAITARAFEHHPGTSPQTTVVEDFLDDVVLVDDQRGGLDCDAVCLVLELVARRVAAASSVAARRRMFAV